MMISESKEMWIFEEIHKMWFVLSNTRRESMSEAYKILKKCLMHDINFILQMSTCQCHVMSNRFYVELQFISNTCKDPSKGQNI